MDFRRVLLLACALLACNCKSLDGLTGGAKPDDDGGAGTGGDAGQQPPCQPNPNVGTLCVTVRVDPNATSPGYGAFSGANTVNADGKGFVQVFLFDKDPTDPANGHVLPTVTMRQPPAEGSETTIDALPQQLVGSAAAGTYYVFAMFADNGTDTRGTGLLSTLPGDFVTPQSVGAATLFPTVTLENDKVQTLDVATVPLRQLALNCTASDTLLSKAAQTPSIHGDGPAGFFIYDGSLMTGAPQVVDFGQANCVDLALQDPNRPADTPVTFGSSATGTHNIWGGIFDYASPTATGDVLIPGTIQTNASTPPQVTFDPTLWTSSADLEFVDVYMPYSGTPPDPQHCN